MLMSSKGEYEAICISSKISEALRAGCELRFACREVPI